ncbi:MAG: FeoA family protein [Verrucomicrobiaceae bacterium]|jgi:Fe2+ transport system protein FeoA|nr:FeoA family protein [Verrucomicrobiaceae bacterium]
MAVSTLADLPIDTPAIIERFLGAKPSLTRLRELGLVPGAQVEVIRRAPLGEPIEIRLRESHIAMRNADAAFIAVLPIE